MVLGGGEFWNGSGAGAGERIPERQAIIAGADQGGAVAEEPHIRAVEPSDYGGLARAAPGGTWPW